MGSNYGIKALLFRLPYRARSPKMLRFPACFQFGSCEIYANFRAITRPNFDFTTDAAFVFYFYIWLGVRRVAQRIVGRGLPMSRTGYNVAYTEIKVEPEYERWFILPILVQGIQRRELKPLLNYPEGFFQPSCYQTDASGKIVLVEPEHVMSKYITDRLYMF